MRKNVLCVISYYYHDNSYKLMFKFLHWNQFGLAIHVLHHNLVLNQLQLAQAFGHVTHTHTHTHTHIRTHIHTHTHTHTHTYMHTHAHVPALTHAHTCALLLSHVPHMQEWSYLEKLCLICPDTVTAKMDFSEYFINTFCARSSGAHPAVKRGVIQQKMKHYANL